MIKDLKFAVQCMKFAYNKKMLSIMTIMFLVLGTLQFSIGRPINYITGGVMLAMAPNMLCQMFQNVNMSNLVLSSPNKRRMGIQIITLLNTLCAFIGVLLFSIAILIVHSIGQCPTEIIGFLFTVEGIMNIVLMVYIAISTKHYIVSSIIFLITFLAVFALAIIISDNDFSNIIIPIPVGIGIALGGVVIAGFLFLGITKLVYKTPIDKHAMQSYLRGEM